MRRVQFLHAGRQKKTVVPERAARPVSTLSFTGVLGHPELNRLNHAMGGDDLDEEQEAIELMLGFDYAAEIVQGIQDPTLKTYLEGTLQRARERAQRIDEEIREDRERNEQIRARNDEIRARSEEISALVEKGELAAKRKRAAELQSGYEEARAAAVLSADMKRQRRE